MVREAAKLRWPLGDPPATEQLEVGIIYFYENISPDVDVDNIIKPILDALKGLAFEDDNQIVDVICRKRQIDSSFRITKMSEVLAEGFVGGKDFLHIRIGVSVDTEHLI